MLTLVKREQAVAAEPTFKTRVQRFWTWYAEVAPRFDQLIQAGDSQALVSEASANLDVLLPHFAWEFGPGENGQGHSFTLSPEGKLDRQLLAMYWLEQAPGIPGWAFYAARQPSPIQDMRLEVCGREFDPNEFWITPQVNRDAENLDITVWHPLFKKMPENERWSVWFLFLDQVLGELGAQQWVGETTLDAKRLADSVPLKELPEFVKRAESEHGWVKLPPGEGRMLYKCDEPQTRFLRGDILVGTTAHPELVHAYADGEGEMEDPLPGLGADYVFVAFDAQFLPAGPEAADARDAMQEAFEHALKVEASGRLLGGAHGTQNAYIDLLLFDGPASIEIVKRVMCDRALPAGSSINYFAKEKRGHRIVI